MTRAEHYFGLGVRCGHATRRTPPVVAYDPGSFRTHHVRNDLYGSAVTSNEAP